MFCSKSVICLVFHSFLVTKFRELGRGSREHHFRLLGCIVVMMLFQEQCHHPRRCWVAKRQTRINGYLAEVKCPDDTWDSGTNFSFPSSALNYFLNTYQRA